MLIKIHIANERYAADVQRRDSSQPSMSHVMFAYSELLDSEESLIPASSM